MAKGAKSGFKTFVILLISLIGAFILGIAAIMLISPGVSIFGLTYATNTGSVIISDINKNGTNENLSLIGYDKIIIDAKDANIFIAYGFENANQTNFSLQKNSSGFYKNGSKSEYTYTLTEETIGTDKVLKFVLKEPEYSFLKIVGATKLTLNMSTNDSGSMNKKIDIKTENGNITMGVGTSQTEITEQLALQDVNLISEKGDINLSSYVDVSNNLNVQTNKGYIKINKDIKTSAINLNSQSGKIITKSFTNSISSVNLTTEKSHIIVENIAGSVFVDAKSGIFEAKNISGDLSASARVESTKFNIAKVDGDIYVANENGKFTVDIGEALGNINISTNSGKISFGSIKGQAFIATDSAPVNVVIADDNTSTILITTNTADIIADFKIVKGANKLSSQKGDIKAKITINSNFWLNATTKNGEINLIWQDKKIKGEVVKEAVGLPTSTENLTIENVSGDISIDRYFA